MSYDQRVYELGIELPVVSNPAAKYANLVEVNGLVFVAGKGPLHNPRGKIGAEFTTDEGYEFAKTTGLQILSVLKHEYKTLDAIKRVVKLQGFVNSTPDFDEPHLVLNGCSELMLSIFGEQGKHARSVFCATSLRDQLPIVVDSIFQLR